MPPYRAKDPPHRATGGRRGRKQYDDSELAEAVRRLQAERGETEAGAIELVVMSIADVLSIDPISARKRVRRALRQELSKR